MTLGRCVALIAVALSLAPALASCSTTANVTDVYMALDSNGDRRRNEFFTDTKEIHCIAKAGIGRTDVTIEGSIRQLQRYNFDSNKFEDTNAVLAYAEFAAARSTGPQTLDLTLKPGPPGQQDDGQDLPYVAGRYSCEILLDGALVGSAIFNVDFPPCPPAIIAGGSFCFGFYRENDQCPELGAGGAQDPKCTCTLRDGWDCPPLP